MPESRFADWLLTGRVTVPSRMNGYFARSDLVTAIEPTTERQVVVLKAPGGFGKTTLLAEVCRRQRERGSIAAWLTLTEHDASDMLLAYLFYAFRSAGLDLDAEDEESGDSDSIDGLRELPLLLRSIEDRDAPCLLVLDDVERLTDPDALATLDRLLRYRPRSLHVAIGCRANPGLDLDTPVLSGNGIHVGVDRLRFSAREVARFFDLSLSRTELSEVDARTEGWPVALQIYRNLRASRTAPPSVGDLRGHKGIASNYLSARLLGHLSEADREFLLDLALFEWIDEALVAEVLRLTDAQRRIDALADLTGLLRPVDRDSGVIRLHPLVREYCTVRRFREAPRRFRSLQRRIARALARRNELVPALRHAREAGADDLVAEILEGAGGLRLWFVEGIVRLRAANRFLTRATMEAHPRLGLLRCVVLLRAGRLKDASALYESVRQRMPGHTTGRPAAQDREQQVERLIVESVLAGYGCLPIGSAKVAGLMAELVDAADSAAVHPALQGVCNLILCAGNYQRARFEVCRLRVEDARRSFARCGSRYGAMLAALHAGLAATAQGHVEEAAESYALARRYQRRYFPEDGGSGVMGAALVAELELERDRMKAVEQLAPDPAALRDTGAWLDVYAAAFGVVTEVAQDRRGAVAAVATVDDALHFARSLGLASLLRYLSALRVTALVAGGRLDQAEEAWQADHLPDAAPAILDLYGQTWREMEAIACARIRLLAARGALDGARELAKRLCEAASACGLVRTRMRGLAAWMVVEHHAGCPDRASECLAEFLALLRATPNPRPLVRDRAVSLDVLRHLLESGTDPESRSEAQAMLDHLDGEGESVAPAFTARELDVLRELTRGARDRDISARLGLTLSGVRYHLKNIYRKSGAAGRVEAVRRVRSLGVLP